MMAMLPFWIIGRLRYLQYYKTLMQKKNHHKQAEEIHDTFLAIQ